MLYRSPWSPPVWSAPTAMTCHGFFVNPVLHWVVFGSSKMQPKVLGVDVHVWKGTQIRVLGSAQNECLVTENSPLFCGRKRWNSSKKTVFVHKNVNQTTRVFTMLFLIVRSLEIQREKSQFEWSYQLMFFATTAAFGWSWPICEVCESLANLTLKAPNKLCSL